MENKKVKLEYKTNEEMLEILSKSDDWVIIRHDKIDLHTHMKKGFESLHLIPLLLIQNEEIWDSTKKMVWKFKK
jgi:hypothetical protein